MTTTGAYKREPVSFSIFNVKQLVLNFLFESFANIVWGERDGAKTYELIRCYTVKCFVQLVAQCFGDFVAGQVARNISQCNIPCNGQDRYEASSKSRCRK